MQKAKLQNQKTRVELTTYYGEGWEEKMSQQILEAEKKNKDYFLSRFLQV